MAESLGSLSLAVQLQQWMVGHYLEGRPDEQVPPSLVKFQQLLSLYRCCLSYHLPSARDAQLEFNGFF